MQGDQAALAIFAGWSYSGIEMELRQAARKAVSKVSDAARAIRRFARLERVLAAFCLAIPALLILFDGGQIRESISAYYDMHAAPVFYFPLTVASMLFVVNGVVKRKLWYNTLLGLLLAGVVLFNRDDFSVLHYVFAIGFFGGNALVILIFTSVKQLWFKIIMVAVIVVAMLGWVVFHWYSLFWAEWISFAIIAVHYILESSGVVD